MKFRDTKPIATYGIRFLDKFLVSINEGELVLIGANSGCGKSTLAQHIAKVNSKGGVRTALFSLENSQGDTMRREIYRNYKDLSGDWKMSFREFNKMVYDNNINEELFEKAEKTAKEDLGNIWLYEKPADGFTVEDLKRQFDKAVNEDGCSLVIIDHLDYFDQLQNEKDENKYLREIMKAIRKLMEGVGGGKKAPVIAFSQFRKPTDQKMIIPTQYEFYGSSDKSKIATTVITIAKNYEAQEHEMDRNLIHTFIAIRKDRFGRQKVADCLFNLLNESYTDVFTLGTTDEWGHYFKEDGC